MALVLAVPQTAFAADPVATPAKPAKERKICKKDLVSTSLHGSRKICKTAAQWKKANEGLSGEYESRRNGVEQPAGKGDKND